MQQIDGLDIVSLLLGLALAFMAWTMLGKRAEAANVPAVAVACGLAGAALILAYGSSELLHLAQGAIRP